MKKLFKQMKNNHFQLNEVKNQLLDKKQEDHSLFFLIKVVIPEVVDGYNQEVRFFDENPTNFSARRTMEKLKERSEKHNIEDFKYREVTVEEVVKNLRKRSREPYLIIYESVLPDGGTFYFTVANDDRYGIIISFNHVNGSVDFDVSEYNPSIHGREDDKKSGMGRPLIKEVLGLDYGKIDRKEEGMALEVIKNKLIPIAVKAVNEEAKYSPGYRPITEEEVRKRLRKINSNTIHGPGRMWDYVRYEVDLRFITLQFDTVKKANKLEVIWRSDPYVGSGFKKSILVYDMSSQVQMNEGLSWEEQHLSKKEEDQAVFKLTRYVLPKVLDAQYNHFLRAHPSMYPERRYPRITVDDLGKHLRKIRTDRVDRVEFESVINDHVYFTIVIVKEVRITFKNQKEIHTPVIIAGVQGPPNMSLEWKWYDVT